MDNSEKLVLKAPILKRLFDLALAAIGCLVGILLTQTEDYILGYAIAICFFLASVVIVRKPRIVISADKVGITVYGSKIIPWLEIRSMDVVTQDLGSMKQHYLAITLVNPDYLSTNSITQGVVSAASQSIAGNTMSDGHKAQVYVLKNDLPGKTIQESIGVISKFKENLII